MTSGFACFVMSRQAMFSRRAASAASTPLADLLARCAECRQLLCKLPQLLKSCLGRRSQTRLGSDSRRSGSFSDGASMFMDSCRTTTGRRWQRDERHEASWPLSTPLLSKHPFPRASTRGLTLQPRARSTLGRHSGSGPRRMRPGLRLDFLLRVRAPGACRECLPKLLRARGRGAGPECVPHVGPLSRRDCFLIRGRTYSLWEATPAAVPFFLPATPVTLARQSRWSGRGHAMRRALRAFAHAAVRPGQPPSWWAWPSLVGAQRGRTNGPEVRVVLSISRRNRSA